MINKELIDSLLEYRGGKLYWKVNKKEAGNIVGVKDGFKGYYCLIIKKYKVYNHIIVYFMHTGKLIKNIKFIDGNSLNYSFENLQASTRSEIVFSYPKRRDNKSGYKGVSWCNTNEKWVAWIAKDKKRKFIGYFTNKEDAALKYLEVANKLYNK